MYELSLLIIGNEIRIIIQIQRFKLIIFSFSLHLYAYNSTGLSGVQINLFTTIKMSLIGSPEGLISCCMLYC